jgi:pimeloyl-ACP methyl ester carboxylesterase
VTVTPEPIRNYFVRTPRGQVVFCAPASVMQGPGPIVLLVHGAFRAASTLVAWRDRLPNVVFANLPGHGGAPMLDEVSLPAWTEALSAAIPRLPRPVLAVGESLGGLVALGLEGVAGVVAFDPFFRTDDLWPVRAASATAAAIGKSSPAAAILAPGQDYFSQLDRLSAPAEVVTGDVPLMPERPLARSPCLLEAEDLARLEGRVRVTKIQGGHNLLDEAPEACRAIILDALARLPDAG